MNRRWIPLLLSCLCAPGLRTLAESATPAPAPAARAGSDSTTHADMDADASARARVTPGSEPRSGAGGSEPGAAAPASTPLALPASTPLALPDLPAYVKEIERIRGLTFKEPVANGTQTLAEFRGFIQKDLDAELPPAEAACASHALGRLGLLPEGFDLRKAFSDLLITQVAAYYDPYRRTFYVVRPDIPEDLLRPTVIHELTTHSRTSGSVSRRA